MSFGDQVKKFQQKVESKTLNIFRGTALSMFGRIVSRTPVGNADYWASPESAPEGYTGGRLRSNWQCDVNNRPMGVIESIDKSGSAANSAALSAVSSADIGDKIYIINNLPYAIPVEYGHSTQQAPEGMVRVTTAEFKNVVRQQIK